MNWSVPKSIEDYIDCYEEYDEERFWSELDRKIDEIKEKEEEI